MRNSLANFISIECGVINENGVVDKRKFNESVVDKISQKTKELLNNFFSTNGCFAEFIQKAMENKNIADYFHNINLITSKSIDEFKQMFIDMNAQINITYNNISIGYDNNIEGQPSTAEITADVKISILESQIKELEKLKKLKNAKNAMINLQSPRSTSSKLSKRRILLLISIALSFLFFVGSALNIKFLIIAIANPCSLILAVGALVLFAILTCIANRYKVIKLSKLFCMDSGGSFFNLRKPPENLPKLEKNISDINKNDD